VIIDSIDVARKQLYRIRRRQASRLHCPLICDELLRLINCIDERIFKLLYDLAVRAYSSSLMPLWFVQNSLDIIRKESP
jgi:hypothetical protein